MATTPTSTDVISRIPRIQQKDGYVNMCQHSECAKDLLCRLSKLNDFSSMCFSAVGAELTEKKTSFYVFSVHRDEYKTQTTEEVKVIKCYPDA